MTSEPTQVVEVWVDGAWYRGADSSWVFWGYVIRGPGVDQSDSGGSLIGPLLPIIGAFVNAFLLPDGAERFPGSDLRHVVMGDWEGAYTALSRLRDTGYRGRVAIYCDSQPFVRFLRGEGPMVLMYAGDDSAPQLRTGIEKLYSSFEQVEWKWIPREQNREADALAKAERDKMRAYLAGLTEALKKKLAGDPPVS